MASKDQSRYVTPSTDARPKGSTAGHAPIADLAGGATLADVINKVNAILASMRTRGDINVT